MITTARREEILLAINKVKNFLFNNQVGTKEKELYEVAYRLEQELEKNTTEYK